MHFSSEWVVIAARTEERNREAWAYARKVSACLMKYRGCPPCTYAPRKDGNLRVGQS